MLTADCVIVGGGIAGLQAAVQLGRYHHSVLVVDAGTGRSALCRSYHNILGWPDGVSGQTLRELGRLQAERTGVRFVEDEVVEIIRHEADGEDEEGFELVLKKRSDPIAARRLLLSTGVRDRLPELPGLTPCLGLTVYVCPDCDGHEVTGKKTIVLGSGDAGAEMALALHYWTEDIVYINHEQAEIAEERMERLKEHAIDVIFQQAVEVDAVEGAIRGIRLADGRFIEGERGFVAFGGNQVKSELAAQLGVERLENRHIVTDPRTKRTSVPHVWAAGDVGAHAEQVTIALGEGSQAAIWIHKSLLQ